MSMFSKNQIVKISEKSYRVGSFTQGSMIMVCSHDGPIYASAKFYHYVEDVFPYNDIEGSKPIVLDDSSMKGSILYIFPEPGSQEFIELIRNKLKISAEFRSRLLRQWVNINGIEYKIAYAYGGERVNIIYRNPGDIGPIYDILFTDDYHTIMNP